MKTIFLTASLVMAFTLSLTGPISGQKAQPPERYDELLVFAESAAGGVQYLRRLNNQGTGVAVTVGPLYGVRLSNHGFDDIRQWATGYVMFGYRSSSGLGAIFCFGTALMLGDDFFGFAPSAQAGFEFTRFGVHLVSLVRLSESGEHFVYWVPLRIGVPIRF